MKRIYGERSTLYDAEGNTLNIPIESVLKNPLYFGQKDLALTRKGYEYDLLNKIIGDKVPDMKRENDAIQKQLIDEIDKLRTLSDIPDKIADLSTENAAIEHKLKKRRDYWNPTENYLSSTMLHISNWDEKSVNTQNQRWHNDRCNNE